MSDFVAASIEILSDCHERIAVWRKNSNFVIAMRRSAWHYDDRNN